VKNLSIWQQLPRPFSVLAPMEDVTDTVFRRLVIECGRPDLFFTEFTSVDGLLSKGVEQVAHRLSYLPEERPLIAQVWGTDPEKYFLACKELKSRGFDGVDINMGCPVDKIVKNGACSALIENPTLAREIFLAAREGADSMPVSIKTRLGFRDLRTIEWCGFLLELEPAALTVHGRIAKHLSKKPANWEEIAKVVKLRDQLGSKTPIIGNGDVKSIHEARDKVALTGVDGVMIGRGIFDNLFLFDEKSLQLKDRSPVEKLNLLLRHIELYEATWQDRKPFRILKKYFKIYVQSFYGASELRVKLVESESSNEVRAHIAEWLKTNHFLHENCSTPSNKTAHY